MMWQDLVFLVGSMVSVAFLYPTLRDKASRVPLATSIPSMIIGCAYSVTFLTLGMTFSAAGAFAACTMWSLIAAFRAPNSPPIFEKLSTSKVATWRDLVVERSKTHTEKTPHQRHVPDRADTDDDLSIPSHSD